jgi:hypothetical protein
VQQQQQQLKVLLPTQLIHPLAVSFLDLWPQEIVHLIMQLQSLQLHAPSLQSNVPKDVPNVLFASMISNLEKG